MTPSLSTAWVVALLATQPAPPGAADGRVTLPLVHWADLQEGARRQVAAPQPPAAFAYVDRSLEGTFDKGLLEATLTTRVEIFDDRGYLQIPIVEDGASLSDVRLDGAPTSVVSRDGLYAVGVEEPGRHEIVVRLIRGQEQDRFARRLALRIPEGGRTRVSLRLAEPEVEAHLAGGAVTGQLPEAGGTRVEGYLDASGELDLTWRRRGRDASTDAVSAEVELHTLVTLGEGLVRGVAVFDLRLSAGETDRLALRVPDGVEILRVTGESVLQWRTDAAGGEPARLDVLFRYLLTDRARFAVQFQQAVADPEQLVVSTVVPADDVPITGALGVQAPAGLGVRVVAVEGATETGVRELPTALTGLTTKPLLHGFTFTAPPRITLGLSRHEQVPLTSTLVDEVQASTVLLADGTEVTKLRLDIRNNTRQYLRLTPPPGATVTHALLDGHPVRPATPTAADAAAGDRSLLFSLRQSERIGPDEERIHVVRPNETLGDIAHRYYADPGKWTLILDANRDALRGDGMVLVGQRLRVPSDGPVTVEESAFVLELALRTEGADLGAFGRRALTLPELDVDAMKVVWHLYLPAAYDPIAFEANLTQYTARRYGLLQRLEQLVRDVFGVSDAAAGGDYQGILSKRKGIYRQEVERRTHAEVTPDRFPLVGHRYRFKRVLADASVPRIDVVYLSEGAGDVARALAFALAFLFGWLALRRGARWWHRALVAVGFVGLLGAAHYVLGVHRLMVWGVALALVVALWRLRRQRPRGPLPAVLREPWRLLELATFRNLLIALGLIVVARALLAWPLMQPVVVAIALFVWWRRWSAAARAASPQEVSHA